MGLKSFQPALICPYTLLEEEALIWSILLFNRAVLLHPFPLSLPASSQSLVSQGLLQVRTLERTQEEIREKDRKLREIQAYIANNPDRGFLKYLKEADSMQDQETQEEIVGFMKGKPFTTPLRDASIVNGPVFLCLIHEWMIKEWEVEASLADIEKQEQIMAQGWQESLEEGSPWETASPLILKKNDIEILCPLALSAWRELKNKLAPEPSILFSTQRWVWADHYGLDPEEDQIMALPLPDLSSLCSANFQKQAKNLASLKKSLIQENLERLLRSFGREEQKRSIDDFKKSLSGLGLPPNGKYQLILPPFQPSLKEPLAHLDQRGSIPLILFSPVLV